MERVDPDRPAGSQVDWDQRIRRCREAQRRPRARELDDQRTGVERDDTADAQFGIEAVSQVIAGRPGTEIPVHERCELTNPVAGSNAGSTIDTFASIA